MRQSPRQPLKLIPNGRNNLTHNTERLNEFSYRMGKNLEPLFERYTIPRKLLLQWSKLWGEQRPEDLKKIVYEHYKQVLEQMLQGYHGGTQIMRKRFWGGWTWDTTAINGIFGANVDPNKYFRNPKDFVDEYMHAAFGNPNTGFTAPGQTKPHLEQLLDYNVSELINIRNNTSSVPGIGTNVPFTNRGVAAGNITSVSNNEFVTDFEQRNNVLDQDKLRVKKGVIAIPDPTPGAPAGATIDVNLNVDPNTLTGVSRANYDMALDLFRQRGGAEHGSLAPEDTRLDNALQNREGRFKKWVKNLEIKKKLMRGAISAGVGALAATAIVSTGGIAALGIGGSAASALLARRIASAGTAGVFAWKDAKRSGKTGSQKAWVATKTAIVTGALGYGIGEYVMPAGGKAATNIIDKFGGVGYTDNVLRVSKNTISDTLVGGKKILGQNIIPAVENYYAKGKDFLMPGAPQQIRDLDVLINASNVELENLKLELSLLEAEELKIKRDLNSKQRIFSKAKTELSNAQALLGIPPTESQLSTVVKAQTNFDLAQSDFKLVQDKLSNLKLELVNKKNELLDLATDIGRYRKNMEKLTLDLKAGKATPVTPTIINHASNVTSPGSSVSIPANGNAVPSVGGTINPSVTGILTAQAPMSGAPTVVAPMVTDSIVSEKVQAATESLQKQIQELMISSGQQTVNFDKKLSNLVGQLVASQAENAEINVRLGTQADEIFNLKSQLDLANKFSAEEISSLKTRLAVLENVSKTPDINASKIVVPPQMVAPSIEIPLAPKSATYNLLNFPDNAYNFGSVTLKDGMLTFPEVRSSQAVINGMLRVDKVLDLMAQDRGYINAVSTISDYESLVKGLEVSEAKFLALAKTNPEFSRKAADFFGVEQFNKRALTKLQDNTSYSVEKFIDLIKSYNQLTAKK